MGSMDGGERARIALVGAGAIAQSYVAAFERSASAELVAVADPDTAAARRTAEPLAIPVFRTHGELLAAAQVDAVIICTPPVYHMEIAIDALRAGVHVLCEKPLTIGAFSARRMFGEASSAARILTMASKFRFVDDIRQAKALMEQGIIGDVARIDNTFMAPVDMTQRWNSRVAVSGGGVLIDNGTHSVDIMRYLLGPLVAAYAVDTSADVRYCDCDDSANLFVRSASGIIGTISLSWSLGTSDPSFLRIHGSAGVIDVGWRGSAYRLCGKEAVAFGFGYDKGAAFRAQIDDFAEAIAGFHPPAVRPADAISSVETIDAAYASMWKNTWTTIELRRSAPVPQLTARERAFVS
jgi:predicted dehydrogenase